MALPNITVNRTQGNIVRPALSNDSTSGMLFYSNTYPSGFSGATQVSVVSSTKEAYDLGIVDDYSTETRALSTITFNSVISGATAVTVTSNWPTASTQVVASFTFSATATASQATELATLINNGLVYSASATDNVVTVTAPQSSDTTLVGSNINTKTLAFSSPASGSVTITAFSGGTSTDVRPWAYHISEHFRLGNGKLYIGVFPVPATFNFNEIKTIQDFANGEIRQVGVYKSGSWSGTFNASDVSSIQSICNTLGDEKHPLSVVLQPNINGLSLNSLPNLQAYSAPNVSVLIGQDGANVGASIANVFTYSVGIMGAVTGVVSTFKVSDSIAWVGKLQSLPFSTAELDTPAFANKTLVSNVLSAAQDTLADKNYIFLRRIPDLSGSFISDSKSAVSNTNSFFSIERNRTIDKSRRVVAAGLSPLLNSPVDVNSDGTLSALTINVYKQVCNTQLDVMVSNGELSTYSVNIDPNQNVLATDTINITLTLTPKGVARFITVDVSFGVTAAA
jgi:hypothetical protein